MNDPTGLPRAARRQQWLEQIDAVLRNSGIFAAGPLAIRALEDGVEHPTLLNLAASVRFQEGRTAEAVALLKRARALAPRDANILNSLGLCLRGLGRTDDAMEAYDAAIRADPRLAPAHYNRASVLAVLNDITAAKAGYERAVALDRNYVAALGALAWLAAQNGDAAEARAYGARAAALDPGDIPARMALAFADLHDRDLDSSRSRLETLRHDPAVTPTNRAIVLGLIGDLEDAASRPAEAFAAYQASSEQLQQLNAAIFEAPGRETALARARRLTRWFSAADPEAWREAPEARPRAADPKAHVFLVGFPRSGTTLLENVLAAHPDVVSLEEKDCLNPSIDSALGSDEGLERLASIPSGEAARQRDAYWAAVRGYGVEPRGKVFIDKMPLMSVNLPLVAKLFPKARILFARRDPRDVVLSCFRRRFNMNPAMYQLLTLEGAASFYDEVMRLSELYRALLPLPQHLIRYESLVEDFDSTARAACAFLELEWNEGLRDFAAKARTRGISTPSAAQVARGLNREGQGSWRRYHEQMAPVLPVLRPWVEAFGYEPD
jgi:tetratricopeptide (TPR) repeat protein